MKLVGYKEENILDKKANVELSVRELVSIWAVFGELHEGSFEEALISSRNLEDEFAEDVLKSIMEEKCDLSETIYDDLSE